MLFPSPAEVRFIELMGGKVYKVDWLRHYKTGYKFTIVLSLGKTLRRQKFKREVRYYKYFADFANDLNRIIEVDGRAYHMDVLKDQEREMDIKARYPDVRFLRIKAYQIYNSGADVQRRVMEFID